MGSFPKNYFSISDHVSKIADQFRDKFDKPCYIIGNGPSSRDASLSEAEAAEGTIFRANWFFLEDEKRFGRRVDGFFSSIDNKGLREAVEDIQALNKYDIKAFF